VISGKAAHDRCPDRDAIGRRVIGREQLRDAFGHQLECSLGECRDEPVLRADDAVDRGRRGLRQLLCMSWSSIRARTRHRRLHRARLITNEGVTAGVRGLQFSSSRGRATVVCPREAPFVVAVQEYVDGTLGDFSRHTRWKIAVITRSTAGGSFRNHRRNSNNAPTRGVCVHRFPSSLRRRTLRRKDCATSTARCFARSETGPA
jgi:hypothetical protein